MQKESWQAESDQLKNAASHTKGSEGGGGATGDDDTADPDPDSALFTEDSVDDIVDEILSEAARSPRVGLMLLSAELERAVRRLLLATGHGDRPSIRSLRLGVDQLVKLGLLTKSAASALSLFTRVRNEIVHGVRRASDDEVLRALDAAIPLLRAVHAIPSETHRVAFEPVPVYSDEGATQQIPGVLGLILTTVSAGTGITDRHIYPTTRDHYVVGRDVSWKWGTEQWGEAWYRDPATDEIRYAWTGSLEFVGRHLD